jgi:hypothetical protein
VPDQQVGGGGLLQAALQQRLPGGGVPGACFRVLCFGFVLFCFVCLFMFCFVLFVVLSELIFA